jgi:hypothetical protein
MSLNPCLSFGGHCDMATTMRYIHPEEETTRQAMQRVRESVDRRAKEAVGRARCALEKDGDGIKDSAANPGEPQNPQGRVN